MRLFIAIDCDEEKKYFKTLQKTISDEDARLTNSFHLTLKFLGEVEDHKADSIINSLREVKQKKFEIEFNHIGFFSNNKERKVIWAGIKNQKCVKELQQEIDEKLNILFKPQKKFLGHLTLCRIKKDKNKNVLQASSKQVESKIIEVKNFKLIQSTLAPKGPIYNIIETFSLE